MSAASSPPAPAVNSSIAKTFEVDEGGMRSFGNFEFRRVAIVAESWSCSSDAKARIDGSRSFKSVEASSRTYGVY